MKLDDKQYEDAWLEGETICMVKGRIGKELYDEGLRNGDLVERANAKGKVLCYTYKEKTQGQRRELANTKEMKKSCDMDPKDSLLDVAHNMKFASCCLT